MTENDQNIRFIPLKEVLKLTSLSRAQIDRLENRGEFPRRVRLGPGRVAWLLQDVLDWISERKRESQSASSTA
jgi:prophage regulatory protein